MEYDANPYYWDKAKVTVQHVKLVYDDGKDPDSVSTISTRESTPPPRSTPKRSALRQGTGQV
jgi:hypothetical protein